MAPRLSVEDEEVIRQLRAQPKISGAEAKKRNENSLRPRRYAKLKQNERDEVRNATSATAKTEASSVAIGKYQRASLIDGAVMRALSHTTLNPNNEINEPRTDIGSDGTFRSVTDKTSSTPKMDINVMTTREPQATPQFTAKVPVPTIVSIGIQQMKDVSGNDRAEQTSTKKTPFKTYGRRQHQYIPRKDIFDISQDATAPNVTMAPVAKMVTAQNSRNINSPASEYVNNEVESDDGSNSDTTEAGEGSLALEESIKNTNVGSQSQVVVDVGLNASPTKLDFESQLTDEAEHSNSEDQDEQFLDELDREVLNLGQNDDDIPSTARYPAPSPKRSRTFDDELFAWPRSKTPDEDALSEIGDWYERPQSKKRRTTRRIPSVEARRAALQELHNKQASKAMKIPRMSQKKAANQSAKKKPRRLPVNELAIASQRIEDSDVEIVPLPPLELYEDPIAPVSSGDTSDEQPSRKRAVKIKNQPRRQRKLVRRVEIPKFRMPTKRSSSSILQIGMSCSDGFEGREANPIGRMIPTRHTIRRHDAAHRVPVYFPQLIIVAERQVGRSDEVMQQPRRRSVERSKTKSSAERMPTAVAQEQPIHGAHDLPQDNECSERPQSPLCVSQHLPTPDTRRIVPLVPVQPELPKGLKDQELPRSARGDPEVERQLFQVAIERQVWHYSEDEDESEDESEIDDEKESQEGDADSGNVEEKSSNGSIEGDESEDSFEDEKNLEIVLENGVASYLANNGPLTESERELGDDWMHIDNDGEDSIEMYENSNGGPSSRSTAPIEAKSLLQQFANQTLEDEHSVSVLQMLNSQLIPIKIQSQPQSYLATQYQDPESSWRPRAPNTAGITMETQEDIHDSPSPIAIQRQRSNNLHNFSPRKRSIMRKRAISRELSIVKHRAESTLSSKYPRHISTSWSSKSPTRSPSPEIPETQYPEPSHTIMVSDNCSYFSQASYQLQTPMKKNPFTRTVSMPAFRHHAQLDAVDEEIFASDTSLSESFKLTVSPEKNDKSRQPRLLSQTPGGNEKTLKMLTRQMSQEMGTIPSRSRTMSALQPRFKTPLRVPVERK